MNGSENRANIVKHTFIYSEVKIQICFYYVHISFA